MLSVGLVFFLFAAAVIPAVAQEAKTASTTTTPAQPAETDLVIPEPGQPATPVAAGQTTATAPGVSTWDFVRMLLVLAAVVGFIYLIFYLLRRGSGKKIQENELIHLMGSRSLSGSRALHLVEVGSSVFLVGSADGGVQLIAEITDKESLDSLKLKAAEQKTIGRRSFQDVLSDIFRPAKGSFSLGQGLEALKSQRDRLKKL